MFLQETYGPDSHRSRESATSCSDDSRMYTKSDSLEATTLGLTIPSAPNAPKIQRDMVYELIQEGSPSEVVLPQSMRDDFGVQVCFS